MRQIQIPQTPDNFFDLYRQRATSLLSEQYPKNRLTIQSSDQLLVDKHDDGEIILSTTTLLILVNVFFRMLTCPHILPDQGNTEKLEDSFTPYPGRFPQTLEELLASADGSTVQPDDQMRAYLAKMLADHAFDYLVCFLAAIHDSRLVSVNPDRNRRNASDYSPVLNADHAALSAIFNTPEAPNSRDDMDSESMSGNASIESSQQHFRFLYFSIITLFGVFKFPPNLPVAVRIVNAQQWSRTAQSANYAQIIQQACNEAILATGEVTRQPPNLDGFNGVLNPGSKKILEAASQPRTILID